MAGSAPRCLDWGPALPARSDAADRTSEALESDSSAEIGATACRVLRHLLASSGALPASRVRALVARGGGGQGKRVLEVAVALLQTRGLVTREGAGVSAFLAVPEESRGRAERVAFLDLQGDDEGEEDEEAAAPSPRRPGGSGGDGDGCGRMELSQDGFSADAGSGGDGCRDGLAPWLASVLAPCDGRGSPPRLAFGGGKHAGAFSAALSASGDHGFCGAPPPPQTWPAPPPTPTAEALPAARPGSVEAGGHAPRAHTASPRETAVPACPSVGFGTLGALPTSFFFGAPLTPTLGADPLAGGQALWVGGVPPTRANCGPSRSPGGRLGAGSAAARLRVADRRSRVGKRSAASQANPLSNLDEALARQLRKRLRCDTSACLEPMQR